MVVLFVMLGNEEPYTSLIRSPARVAATVVASVSHGEKATLAWMTKSLHKLPRLPVDVTLSTTPAPLLILMADTSRVATGCENLHVGHPQLEQASAHIITKNHLAHAWPLLVAEKHGLWILPAYGFILIAQCC